MEFYIFQNLLNLKRCLTRLDLVPHQQLVKTGSSGKSQKVANLFLSLQSVLVAVAELALVG
jgi:hypothetical protein